LTYYQVTEQGRYQIPALRQAGCRPATIARHLGRHRSTVSRELSRNCSPWDGGYRPSKAQEQTNGRRSRSRRNLRFQGTEWKRVEGLLREDWSPEQISGWLGKEAELEISHETIYRYVGPSGRRLIARENHLAGGVPAPFRSAGVADSNAKR